tara:strand:- start:61191 stop:61640 length:450 start_codon:yes stop_codon:yes gene_type:complete
MADFTHLGKLRVQDDATAEYTFFRIAGEPTLTVRAAHESNRDFFNAALKRSKAAMRRSRGRKNQMPTQEMIEQARQEDIVLFAKYVVVSWTGVIDAEDQDVEMTPEVCAQFLDAIPPDMFTELRAFCLDIENFREDGLDSEDLEDLLGN